MNVEQRRQAWVIFAAGALAAGKSPAQASTDADETVKEMALREPPQAPAQALDPGQLP